jgi:hypothetical protein
VYSDCVSNCVRGVISVANDVSAREHIESETHACGCWRAEDAEDAERVYAERDESPLRHQGFACDEVRRRLHEERETARALAQTTI